MSHHEELRRHFEERLIEIFSPTPVALVLIIAACAAVGNIIFPLRLLNPPKSPNSGPDLEAPQAIVRFFLFNGSWTCFFGIIYALAIRFRPESLLATTGMTGLWLIITIIFWIVALVFNPGSCAILVDCFGSIAMAAFGWIELVLLLIAMAILLRRVCC